jgi:ABC-2 type transport system permease protein
VIRALWGAVVFQLTLIPRDPTSWMAFVIVPINTVLFLTIVLHAGREDLVVHAVVAPAIIAVWTTAIFNSSEIISHDREGGTLEALLATPAPLVVVLLGRITTVTIFSMIAVVESWLVAVVVFGQSVPVHHPAAFGLAVVITAFGVAGTATALSALLVLARSARAYVNSLSYPIYLLGGVMVPVSMYPEWLQPLGRLLFLSWSTDLLRDTLQPAPVNAVGPRVAAVVVLGAAAFAIGIGIFRRVLNRVRANGTVSLA